MSHILRKPRATWRDVYRGGGAAHASEGCSSLRG